MKPTHYKLSVLLVAGLCSVSSALAVGPAWADDLLVLPASEPTVSAMLPAGVTRGSSVEVTLSGNNLAPADTVRVTGEGVSAELVPLPKGGKPNPRQVAVTLTAVPNAAPGLRELRLVTPSGTSNVVRFVVGALPETMEAEPNETAALATRLAQLPVVVNGVLDRGEDRDCFRFSAQAGQQIVLDLFGQRLHPYVANQRPGWLEGLLTVREATEIGQAADELLLAEQSAAEKGVASKGAAAALTSSQSVAKTANDAKNAADKELVAKSAAAKTAAEQLAAAMTAAEQAIADQTAAANLAAEKANAAKTAASAAAAAQAAADAASAGQAAADKVAAERAAIAKAASDRATAIQAAVELLGFAADKAAAEKVAAEKTVAATAAADGVAAAQTAVQAAAAEEADAKRAALDSAVQAAEQAVAQQAAAEQTLAEKTLIFAAVEQKIAAAATIAKQAADEHVAAATLAAKKGAVAETATDRVNAAKKAVEKAAVEQAAADKSLADRTATARAGSERVTAMQVAAAKANAERVAAQKSAEDRAQALAAANERVAAAQEAAKQAADELAAANTSVLVKRAARDQLADQPFRHLAYAQDFAGREDPLLIFTAPQDGQYVVEVRDDLYRGRSEFNYRLTIGELPYVTAAFPAGGRRGATVPANLEGFNLGGDNKLSLTTIADAPLGQRWERIGNGLSNDVALEVSDDAEILEAEPNDAAEQATTVQTPIVLNGIIERDGDVDCYKFTATKGQRLIFETTSGSIGSPLDGRLELCDANSRRLKDNDDSSNTFDSLIDHTFAADGEYVIRISDTTGYGSRRHVYRLHVRPPRPDFTLMVSPDNPRVTAGGSVPLRVRVRRRDGFNGDIELTVSDAPSGAIVSPAVLSSGQSEQTLSLTMPADAVPGIVPVSVVGKAKIGEQEVVRAATPAEQIRYVNDWRYVPVNDLVLTVLPPAPLTLTWANPAATVISGETIQVPIKLQRAAGFNAAVRVVMEGLPSRVAAPPVTIEENATEAIVEIRCSNGAPASLANVVVNGSVTFNGRSFVQSSPALRLQVEVPEKK